jgi:glycerol-1-phosphate dehydrogenase [NAD(P)+]
MNITINNIDMIEIKDFLGNEINCECKKPHHVGLIVS